MSNTRFVSRHLALSTAICGILSTLSAAPVNAAGFALEEIVVSARKQDETLQDVPIAVSSFSADDMQSLNLNNTKDLAAFTPSVYIEPAAANNATAAKTTIRGQVQADTLITMDSSVGWYIDDVYLARAYGTQNSLFDVERVEVLKGPQGTLYGRNTTGGTIKLVTTKADTGAGVTGYVTGGAGSFGAWKAGGAVNLPIVEDVLAVRLTALRDEVEDGYGQITVAPTGLPGMPSFAEYTEDVGTKSAKLFRIGATYDASDDLQILASFERSELDVTMLNYNTSTEPGFAGDQRTLAGFVRSSDDYYKARLNALPRSTADADTAALTAEYQIADQLGTKVAYGYRNVKSQFMSDIDGTDAPASYFMENFIQNAEQHSLEWQIQGAAFDDALDWMTGLYYFQERGVDISNSGSFGAVPSTYTGFPTIGTTGVRFLSAVSAASIDKNKSQSAFFNGTWHILDELRMNFGARYTEDKKPIIVESTVTGIRLSDLATETACRFSTTVNPPPNADGSACTWGQSEKYSYWSWNFGFDYDITPDVLGYVKMSSASRAGGQNLRGLDADTTAPFQPEKATDFEIGVKGRLFDDQLQLNADYYHTFYKEIQQSQLIVTHPTGLYTQVLNRAKADIDGVEVEATWLVTEYFKLTGTAAYLDWKFEDSTSLLPSTPGLQYTARANYSLPVSYGDWLFDLNYSWRDEYYANTSRQTIETFESATVDSLGLWGARVGLDLTDLGLNLAVWGRNLSDEEYYVSPQVLGTTLSTSSIGEPRSFGIDATYKF